MKIWPKLPIFLGVVSWALMKLWAEPAPVPEVSASIQAIQQAADPSAVVAAFANGVALGRDDPQLYEAYISRMTDLGLPELAFHQAQTLTTLRSDNGLAWGIIAYVNARKGEMPEAISAIDLAGQSAPDNVFVQRTAGEIAAWYDVKADKATLSDVSKTGLTKIRGTLEARPAFKEAYNTAKSAYQAQANAAQTPTQTPAPQTPTAEAPAQTAPPAVQQAPAYPPPAYAPPQYAYAPPAYPYSPPPYYPDDYYYDWGSSWVQPAPWWWWHPVGFFVGFDFFPFSSCVVFDHHHHFDHNHGFVHDPAFFHNHFSHNGVNVAFHGSNHGFFVHNGQTTFFATGSHPTVAVNASFHSGFRTPVSTFGVHGSGGNTVVFHNGIASPAFHSAHTFNTAPTFHTTMPAFRTMPQSTFRTMPQPAFRTMPQPAFRTMPQPAFRTMPQPAFHTMPPSAFSSPRFATAPHSFNSMPASGFGGGFHGGGMPAGGGFHGGGMPAGGGFHGGGGHSGGGHR